MSWCHCTENGHKKSLKAIQSFDRWRNWGQKKVSELQQWIHVFWAQFSGSFCCTSVSQQAKSTARERLYGQTPDITQFYPQIMQVSNFYLFICPELPRIYFCFTNRDFAHFCINACMLSCFRNVQLIVIPRTIDHQAPLSLGFSRQEYWSVLPCPSPGDLPNPGIKPVTLMSPALAGRFFTTSTTWEALCILINKCYFIILWHSFFFSKFGICGFEARDKDHMISLDMSNTLTHWNYCLIFYLCSFLLIFLCQNCSHFNLFPSFKYSQMWAHTKTFISLMKILLFPFIPFFSQLLFIFPTVSSHSCWSSCYMPVTTWRLFRLSHSTFKFIFINTSSLS